MSNRKRLAGLLLPGNRLHGLSALLGMIFLPLLATLGAEAKTPGETYCFHGTCHRVLTIRETEQRIGILEILHTSYYSSCKHDRYNPCGLTSSGETFHPERPDNAASPVYPDGTMLLLRNPETQDTAVVRVNNAGPYWGRRKLDVSQATAEKLGFRKRGVARLEVRVIKAPKPSEARYRRHRSYDPVPGYIGRFVSADTAHAGVASFMAWERVASALFGAGPGSSLLTVSEKGAAAADASGSAETGVRPSVRHTGKVHHRSARGHRLASSRTHRAGGRRYAGRHRSGRQYAGHHRSSGRRYASHGHSRRGAKPAWAQHGWSKGRSRTARARGGRPVG